MVVGDKFKLTEEAIENYGEEYRDKVFTVSHVARNREQHPGYDEAVGGPLYDARGLNFSLYNWEVRKIRNRKHR